MKPNRGVVNRPIIRAFWSSPVGIASLSVILVLVLVAAGAPTFLRDRAERQNFVQTSQSPSWSYWLGTDQLGRDVFARLVVATQLSLLLALAAAGLGLVIGVTLGGIVPVLGGRARPVLQRFIDTMLSFPGILLAIFIAAILGPGSTSAIIGVGVAISFSFARVTSALSMSVGGRDYINAAKVLGVRRPRLVLRYVLPNIGEPIAIAASVAITAAIVQVSALSFLGLGVQPPAIDWGRMLTEGVNAIYTTPAAALGPAAAIALSAIAFGFFGEAVAHALNPLRWTAYKKARDMPAATAGGEEVPAAAAMEARHTSADVPVATVTGAGHRESSQLQAAAQRSEETLALRVRDLRVTFPGPDGSIEVLKGISFDVHEGEILGIVGESGSGKTMTALSVARLVPHPGRVAGSIVLHGTEISELSGRQLDRTLGLDLAFVFQDPMSSLNPALRVGPQMALPLRVHRDIGRKAAVRRAVSALQEVHIPEATRQVSRYPHEFSGGMRQRAMIAKGLMKEPSLLIADEPTTALDVTIQAQIMDLINEINQSRKTAMLLISHNLALVSQNCHRVIVMYAGRIVEELDIGQLITEPKHPYTRALISSLPEVGHARTKPLVPIPGEIPEVASPPPGCSYHPRCPLAIDRCRIDRPLLLARAEGGRVACHVANDDFSTTTSSLVEA